MRATSEIVWWGERNGRVEMRVSPRPSLPATEWICVVSKLSAKLRGGKMEGRRFAIMLLPQPGLPTNKML